MIPSILSLLFFSTLTFADTYRFFEQTTQIPYEIISSSLNFRVVHPLRVVVSSTEQVNGILLADLQDLSRGIRSELFIPTSSISGPDSPITARLHRILKSKEFPKLEFSSVKLHVQEPKTTQHFPLILEGELKVGGNSSAASFMMDCQMQGVALVCKVSSVLSLAHLQIPVPRLAGLVTKDSLELTGAVTFRAQR